MTNQSLIRFLIVRFSENKTPEFSAWNGSKGVYFVSLNRTDAAAFFTIAAARTIAADLNQRPENKTRPWQVVRSDAEPEEPPF